MAAASGDTPSERAVLSALDSFTKAEQVGLECFRHRMGPAVAKVAALVLLGACCAAAGRDFEQARPSGHGRRSEMLTPARWYCRTKTNNFLLRPLAGRCRRERV